MRDRQCNRWKSPSSLAVRSDGYYFPIKYVRRRIHAEDRNMARTLGSLPPRAPSPVFLEDLPEFACSLASV
ncbi:unnamed protein product [Heligmosomoides polygyrus]|uniref:Uncharacterized protein n=1 Tax=Heligmosomoides polygyrus TaxID=6339 RepID=A0A183FFU9_HELPZ|nr:unnamed protein product [Heligmosomoides polygyrus]